MPFEDKKKSYMDTLFSISTLLKRWQVEISKKDIESLEESGVGKLYGPGTPVNETIDYITNWVNKNRR